MLTKSLENPDDRVKLLNVLLGKSQGCSVANLSGKSVNFPFFGGWKTASESGQYQLELNWYFANEELLYQYGW